MKNHRAIQRYIDTQTEFVLRLWRSRQAWRCAKTLYFSQSP